MQPYKIIATLMMSCLLGACGQFEDGHHYNFSEFEIFTHSQKLTENFPSLFIYKDATIPIAGSYGNLVYNRQGVIVMESNDDAQKILNHYNRVFEARKWQIIQSSHFPDSSLIMAESSSRQLITIILHKKSPVQIKLYYKQSGIL